MRFSSLKVGKSSLVSCHSRPPIHFLSPRDADKSNPSTRIMVDNINVFRRYLTELNAPYANKDIEDLFHGVGPKTSAASMVVSLEV